MSRTGISCAYSTAASVIVTVRLACFAASGAVLYGGDRNQLMARHKANHANVAYAPDADPGLNDSLVPQQGPNYALAKRLQRWRR